MNEVHAGTAASRKPPMSKAMVMVAVVGCLLTLLLALLDTNIVSAVSWKMVKELDPGSGIDMLPWMITAYALADCVVLPLYGKLADVYGAKPIYIVALVIFMVGSCLCGLAQNMVELILFRALQGIGGGGLISVTMVILGMLGRSDDKPGEVGNGSMKVGLGGIMVGLGIALGPLLGAVLAEKLDWRWIFYINLPLAAAALLIAIFVTKLPWVRQRSRIDFLGAALIGAAACALLLAADWTGKRYSVDSPIIIGLLVAGAALLGGFIWRTLTAAEPLISLRLLRNPVFQILMPIAFLAGMGLAGEVLYLVGYLQIGRGIGLLGSGLMCLPLAAGMALSFLLARAIVSVVGKFKYLLTAAGVLQAAVILPFSGLTEHTSLVAIEAGLFVLGLGMGQSVGLVVQFMQNAVDLRDIGVATTTQRFTQALGLAVGFAVFGVVMTHTLGANLTGATGAANKGGSLDIAVLATLPPDQHQAAVHAFITAVGEVFLIAGIIAIVPAVLALFIKEKSVKATKNEDLVPAN